MRGIFWTVLFFVGLVTLISWGPLKHPIIGLRLAFEEPPQRLPMPVLNVTPGALRATWGAFRDGGRTHQGIDIFAPRGTPVRSTTRGLVLRVGQNRLGGNVVWIFGPGGQRHYYAHLDRFGNLPIGIRLSYWCAQM